MQNYSAQSRGNVLNLQLEFFFNMLTQLIMDKVFKKLTVLGFLIFSFFFCMLVFTI